MSFLKIKAKNGKHKKVTKNTKDEDGARRTVQEILDIQNIEDNIIQNSEKSKYYIRISPKNINIFTNEFLLNEIQNLKSVCNVTENIEFLVVDKVERLEDNKKYIEKLLDNAGEDIFRMILEKDLEHFKKLESAKGSSREFYFVISFKNGDARIKQQVLNIEQALENKGFTILNCYKDTLKNMIQVYLERNFSGEVLKDFDL